MADYPAVANVFHNKHYWSKVAGIVTVDDDGRPVSFAFDWWAADNRPVRLVAPAAESGALWFTPYSVRILEAA